MAYPGKVIENPQTGERIIFQKTARETNGELLRFDLHVGPYGYLALKHLHYGQTESFEIVSGRVHFLLGEEERILSPGEKIVIPRGVPEYWWNPYSQPVHMIVEERPALKFEVFLESAFGLARDSYVPGQPLPPLPLLQAAVILQDQKGYAIASPPRVLQRIAFPILARIARLRGYRSWYPRYSEWG